MKAPSVLFFDVNETLLELTALKKSVTSVLNGREELVPLWFSTLLHYSLVENVTGDYKDFSEIGVAALQMVAAGNGITITKEQAEDAVIKPFKSLMPYKEVKQALEALRDQGFKLVALTNSSTSGLAEKLAYAGIKDNFDTLLSCETVGAFKPSLEVYSWALSKLNVQADDAMMIAAHGWDITGAKRAGMQTTFISRPGKQMYPLAQKPDYTVDTLDGLVDIFSNK
ncbi:haloacid dehalogenase type II [Dokdonia sp. Dokd-P16]|uniref:haloacid dehalogenase type II n=1 Tax=Dokdonia sp. Dokd-P16 TaxID=2173169 RepID=UPI000D54A709|nr:haloacid dehalogenase type II [Dokdonia sp. Dokd-P16]AWH73878.1 haloacid dehalogenase type II [Dokdonia sp. Dokd-P16]